MSLSTFRKSQKAKNPHYLLFGHPIEHSWSPLMHNLAFDHYDIGAQYYTVDLLNSELNSLASYLNNDFFKGANITVPYKQVIIDYLDYIDRSAKHIGAVNTIVREGYQLVGYNTDYAGFVAPLKDYGWELEGGRAIVFGTGGASRAIVAGLVDIGIEEIFLVSRNPARNTSFPEHEQVEVVSYHQWTSLAEEAALIVNATPLGMHPNVDQSPVRETEKTVLSDCICYDIVYNPLQTTFLKQANSVGAKTINGLEMLIQQGSRSFELWTGHSFPVNKVRDKLHEQITN
ncbi:shikimate dehydrogenase [Fodinibius halophilus]|uniref:Shikimate dehydrogenase (NADP(+)) n=1 Tax=Fodinibius halophilus TaxID=1736908 RepID=A0A6M1SZ70_9BACT|nr:shikimate dehydrogenase [Fodinibius halophilus]NGP86957.1 shikimate dehydrogenase [Fodinibius halophilus]